MTTALRLRHRLEYGLVAGIRGMLRHLPMKAVLAAGSGLGYVFYALDRGHRRLALANLNAAFPQRPLPERRAIAREMFAHFGRLLMVLLKFSTMARDEMLAHVEFEGDDRVRAAHTHGRGVLLFTGHFGYWEINALVHALALHPIAVVARPLDNPLLHDLLEHVRSMTGNSVIYRKGGLRRILRALAANDAVALLIDQHIHGNAVHVEFFNRPAATTTALGALAARTGAPVIPVFALPLPDGRFRMVYEHAVDPPRGTDENALRDFTQRCTDVLEMYVRRYPDLWLWMHRRWRDVDAAGQGVPGMFPTARREEDSE
ncbi:MAG TPA: lysophospholipid acyltransferase family protein [Vicinamibacterales bacterium]|jgi:Kdo2-lipid IVA lauroyltransferase/acyltransferase|nr:lysophospholipid acyltransferase family protein [Vicinamibacterales bacterium]